MNTNKNTPRFLGAAFLFQAVAALVWTLLLSSLIVTGDIFASMTNIANNTLQMRASIVVAMLTAVGIAILGSLLFVTLKAQNEKIALIALGLYLIEATILAVSRLPAFALLRVSQEFVTEGHPIQLQSMGNLLYESADFGDWLHMIPFTLGALLFYYLFFKSEYIPRVLSLWGLTAVTLSLMGTLLVLLGYDVPMWVFYLNLPFELTIGVWLMVKGIPDGSETNYRLANA